MSHSLLLFSFFGATFDAATKLKICGGNMTNTTRRLDRFLIKFIQQKNIRKFVFITNKQKIHTRHKIFHKYFIMPRNKTQMAKMYKNCKIKSILRSFRVSLERSEIIIKSSLVPRSYPYLFSFFARFAFVIQTHESRTNNKSHKWLLEKQEERNIQQEGK